MAWKQVIAVYCCGGIKKGEKDKDKIIWGEKERSEISDALAPAKVVFLSLEERSDDVSDAFTVFGRDHYQISLCDFVVADLRQKRGIGVGIEMLSAKLFKKPLIVVAPPDHHYRRQRLDYLGGSVEDYIHAHLFGVADAIVDDFKAAGLWVKSHLQQPKPVKDVSVVKKAIAEYKKKQLPRDVPMLDALKMLKRA